jgi:hypothetical protein
MRTWQPCLCPCVVHGLEKMESNKVFQIKKMSMCGAWIGEDGVQQGFPNQEGGPRLIRFESLRWRPKAIQVRAQFGVEEQCTIKRTPRLHTESVLDVLYMVGSTMSWRFQWHRSHAKIHPESTGIFETS